MNAEAKLEKRRLQLEEDKLLVQQISELIKNPLIEFILGSMFIAYATRGTQSTLERMTGIDLAAGTLGAGLVGVISAQQLSSALPYIVQAGGSIAPDLIKGLLLK